MGFKSIISFFSIFLSSFTLLCAQSLDVYTEALEKGQKAVENNDFLAAADLWNSQVERKDMEVTDPRIGFSYIEMVTARNMKEQYDKAFRSYRWGLSNPAHPEFEKALRRETERLQPIADRDTYRSWRRLLRDEEFNSLGESILNFWDRLDPTINTPFNERLMEHWERIAYARENYTRTRSTVFDADERALIYVKLGEPDYTRDGTIGYNIGQVQMWVQDAMKISFAPSGPMPSGSDSVSRATAKAQLRANMMSKMAKISNFEREVRYKHRYPSYEIWVYRDILPENRQNLIYIFGDDGDTGEFGLRRSMEELFPNSAFRRDMTGMGIPPSFFLQLVYYQEVITVDNYFANAFNELESKIYNINGVSHWDSQQMKSRNYSRLVQAQLRAPSQRSSILNNIPQIPLDIHQYRLLNEENEPYLATFIYSHPYRAYYFDQMKTNSFNDQNYRLASFAMSSNDENQIFYKKSATQHKLKKLDDFRGNIDNISPELTYLEVPHSPQYPNQKFIVELKNENMDSASLGEQIFRENIRAMGNATFEHENEPLSQDKSSLEMGDLILGVADPGSAESNPFGFRLEPDETIYDGENLAVHIEVYHLNGTSTESVPFQIVYTVKEKTGFFKRLFTKQDEVTLSLNFESSSDSFRENLEIDTSPFDPGDYTLELTARVPDTEQQVSRTIRFNIEERE